MANDVSVTANAIRAALAATRRHTVGSGGTKKSPEEGPGAGRWSVR